MSLHQDWEGIAQDRSRAWEAEVRRYHLRQQIPRRHPSWRRRAGHWLIRLGAWLAEGEPHPSPPQVNATR